MAAVATASSAGLRVPGSSAAGPTSRYGTAAAHSPASQAGSSSGGEGMASPSLEPYTLREWDGLDVSPLRDLSRRALFQALDSIPSPAGSDEPRSLFLDPSLAGALGLVVDVASLKQHGIERMFWLELPPRAEADAAGKGKGRARATVEITPISAPTRSVVYLCRPETKWMRVIAGHILADKASSPPNATASLLMHSYTILFTPRRTELCLKTLSGIGLTSSDSAPSSSDQAAAASSTTGGQRHPSVLPYVTIIDYGLEFVPLASDVLSLELLSSWSALYSAGDHSPLYYAAQALMTMQHAFGLFPRILGKGELARRLCDLLIRQRREHIALDPRNPALTRHSASIDSLIIIDRSVDLASPLCSQLTYEGLLDEIIGIESAHVELPDLQAVFQNQQHAHLPADQTASGSNTPMMAHTPRVNGNGAMGGAGGGKRKKHHLDASADRVHAAIRDDNFAVVGMRLHEIAKRLNANYDARHSARTVPQMRAFVGRLSTLEADRANLGIHTGLAQAIMRETSSEHFAKALEVEQNLVAGVDAAEQLAAIEDMINMEFEPLVVLRLLCLASVTSGGLKAKNLEFIKRELLQTYGYELLPLLLHLGQVGLLTKSAGSATGTASVIRSTSASAASAVGGVAAFSNVRRSLKLINDDVDEQQPRDISYVYSGYAPLSVRLVQAIAQKEAFIDLKRRTSAGAAPPAQDKPKAHPIIGWRGFEDVIASLPGATVDEVQSSSSSATTMNPTMKQQSNSGASGSSNSDPDHITTTVVVFIGGITYAEIAALRFMSRQSHNRRFLICTTQTINGNSMLRDLAGTQANLPARRLPQQ